LNAAKKIILLLWLVLVASLGNASALTPGASENRVWEKSLATLETRQGEPQQTAGRHQENGVAGYDYAVDCLLAAEGTAPNLMYHYTTASESSFANGLWEGSSVTDKLYTDAAQASQELGIPVPNKVIPIQNTGQFVPNAPSIVQPSPLRGWSGGGTDFINPQRVPPSQLFPAQPIGPR
jgi:hypothetical protein